MLGTALSPKFGNDREAPEEEVEEVPKLGGTLVKYGDRANMGSFVETIEPGAFAPVEELDAGINVQHKRDKPLARTQGGGLVLVDSPEALKAEFELPDTQDGRDAAELISKGVLRGLSIEMSVPPDGQRWSQTPDGKSLRTITRAKLHGLGIVDSPAYTGSLISQRALEYALGLARGSHRKGFGHMAVTIEQLFQAINLGDENTSLVPEIATRLSSLLAASQARVDKAASSNTPPEIIDEAVTRMVG